MNKKDFNSWNELKKVLHMTEFDDYVHEREVWWCSIGLNIGSEQDGKNHLYERPVLILRKFSRETVLVVPITSKSKKGDYYASFLHKDEAYSALLLGIREVSTRRLQRRMYTMNSAVFCQIKSAVIELIKNNGQNGTPA